MIYSDTMSLLTRDSVDFGPIELIGVPDSVPLYTRKLNEIENQFAIDPQPADISQFYELKKAYGWIERRPPYGICNCAGLVWASRRTGIYKESQWRLILSDDGYRQLGNGEKPIEGDLVIYENPGSREPLLHVGIIVGFGLLTQQSTTEVPRVLSKLCSVFGEVIHRESDILAMYRKQGTPAVTTYWSDRP